MKIALVFLLLSACLSSATYCKQPLDAQTLNRLSLGWDDLQLHPGDTHQFSLMILSTFAPSQDVPACVAWKVEPAGKGATITSAGLLTIDPKSPPHSRFVVTADIEQGRAQRQIGVLVYTSEDQPLVGFWREKSRSGCLAPNQNHSPQPVQELEFRANGWFSVTWVPFETYRDYWGSYAAENSSGKLSLKTEGGNYVPKNFRGTGKFQITDKNTLELTGVYLGGKQASGQDENGSPNGSCRYIFIRLP